MKIKNLLVLLVIATLVTACAPVSLPGGANANPPGTISVTGTAQIPVDPDVVYIQVGVHTEDQDVAAAVQQNSDQLERVRTGLLEQGVAEKDMQTTNFSVYGYDKYDNTGTYVGFMYSVDNTLYLTVRDISKIGAILDDAVNNGANNIYSIQFDVSDKSAILSEGRVKAVAAARAQAEELAAAAGVTLGDLVNISTYGGGYTSPYWGGGYGGGGGGGAAQEVSISAGQLYIQVDVTMVFALDE